MNGKACNYFRNRDGFCRMTSRCWSGKPCPRTERQADAAHAALVDEIIKQRDSRSRPQPSLTT